MTAAAQAEEAPRERGIIFSAPMVLALLADQKTQTRRLVGPQDRLVPGPNGPWYLNQYGGWQEWVENAKTLRCPYGRPGDRLWVKESFVYRHKYDRYYYRADHPVYDPYAHNGWRPSIFMPRAASRITLELTAVRVERLQDLSLDDVFAELGETRETAARNHGESWEPYDAFAELWDSINGKRAPWSSNPWVWVLTFRRVQP